MPISPFLVLHIAGGSGGLLAGAAAIVFVKARAGTSSRARSVRATLNGTALHEEGRFGL